MLTETSFQAQVLKPLITSLVFGLASSAVMILFLVPALYRILEDSGPVKAGSDAGADIALQVPGPTGIIRP